MRNYTFEEQKRNKTLFKLITEQVLLYEGLELTYSKKATKLHLDSLPFIKDFSIENGNNIGTYYFKVKLVPQKENLIILIRDMNTYGYYVLDCDEAAYEDNIDNFIKKITGGEITLNFEPKFAPEVTDDVCGKYNGILYHITDVKNINKIQKNGLTPKTSNMIGKYPDRVYCFLNKQKEDSIIEIFSLINPQIKEFALFEININATSIKSKWFYDIHSYESVFTLECISPINIKLINIIKLQ